jgi:hypothetical protein
MAKIVKPRANFILEIEIERRGCGLRHVDLFCQKVVQ